jgi:tricorn protease
LIGISGNPGLADGGMILVSTFRFLGTDGQWAVENEGVAPDINVVDRPEQVAAGQDPSLERAVALLLEELEKNPVEAVSVPPAPTNFRD